jgi:hypothetical protein
MHILSRQALKKQAHKNIEKMAWKVVKRTPQLN